MGISNVIVYFLAGLAISFSQYISPVFHRTFSSECAQSNILTQEDCPLVGGKTQWSRERQTAESDTKFMVISESKKASKKCFSKLSVYTQICNALPQCVMTTYKYALPKVGRSIDPARCTNEYTIESKCKTNGPGGRNTKAVYNHCFYRGTRPFCGIKFESCQPEPCFKWTKYQRQCYAECNTTAFSGVALQFVRKCKECDGGIVDDELCKGGKEASIQLRRCASRSRARAIAPDCVVETTTPSTATFTTVPLTTPSPAPPTTKAATTAKKTRKPRPTGKITTTMTTTTKPTTTTTEKTSAPTKTTTTAEMTTASSRTKTTTTTATTVEQRNKPTKGTVRKDTTSTAKPTSSQVTTLNLTTSKRRKKPTKTETTSTVTSRRQTTTDKTKTKIKPSGQSTITTPEKLTTATKRSKPTRKPRKTTKKPKTTKPKASEKPKVDSRILEPPQAPATTKASLINETVGKLPAHDKEQTYNFDLVSIAGGVGAGIMFLFVIVIIVVLLVKRRDTKPPPESSFTSSSLRSKTTKSAIVDSSSFRIATWIRERPSARHGSSSSFDSAVSDAEYWRVGSSGGTTAPYSSEKQSQAQNEKVPDIVKTASTERGKNEHIYDEVEFGDIEDMRTVVPRQITPRKSRHTSSNVYSNIDGESAESPTSEGAVYAVVNKDAKKGGSNGPKHQIASEHSSSVTRLNGRQLKEGVLQIEFDEKEGVRCRLSNSNVYMNLEETEPPPVV